MEPPSSNSIAILNHCGRRIPEQALRECVEKTLALHEAASAGLELLLTDDVTVTDLNRRFRGLDEPTDVLTFPTPANPAKYLGEVAIAVPYAERQAEARGVPLDTELCYLAIHGVLHLLGYEDEDTESHRLMLAEMNRAGTASGLPPDPEWQSLLHEGVV